MKKLILSVVVTTMLVSTCYAQTTEELHKARLLHQQKVSTVIANSGDPVIEPIAKINPETMVAVEEYLDAKAMEGTYYSKYMDVNFIVEYGVSSCPNGYTKYNVDKSVNYGCETVDEFTTNVQHKYYTKL